MRGLPEQAFRLVRKQTAKHGAAGDEYVMGRHIQCGKGNNAVRYSGHCAFLSVLSGKSVEDPAPTAAFIVLKPALIILKQLFVFIIARFL
jgi:hypothetical protein